MNRVSAVSSHDPVYLLSPDVKPCLVVGPNPGIMAWPTTIHVQESVKSITDGQEIHTVIRFPVEEGDSNHVPWAFLGNSPKLHMTTIYAMQDVCKAILVQNEVSRFLCFFIISLPYPSSTEYHQGPYYKGVDFTLVISMRFLFNLMIS